jgi:hypothetical protein
MAVYKVPQDVEADDKLIGPFSFRQFIYLIIVAISIAGAWGLSQLFLALAIIPMPIIIFFAALALPLRKDQPMETYLSAVVSFYFLKPRKRLWQPDGINSFVTIIPPKDADKIYTKDLDETEATRRLSYLADLVDTHGWAIRGAGSTPDTSISTDLYYESQQTPDMMDDSTPAAQAMSQQLADGASQQKQSAISNMQQIASRPAPAAPQPVAPNPQQPAPVSTNTPIGAPVASPEPVSTLPSMAELKARQEASVQRTADKDSRDAIAYAMALAEEASENRGTPVAAAAPTPTPAQNTPLNTSVSTPAAGTMGLTREQADELSQQSDVSVQTLAQQANRVAAKNKVLRSGDEVTISFH